MSTQFKLPLIDFTKLEDQQRGLDQVVTHEWNHVRDHVNLELQEVGSFEAMFGEIVPIGVQESMIGLVRDAFDLCLELRLHGVDNLCMNMYHRYVEKSEANPFYESFGVVDMGSDEGVERICKCLWTGGGPPRSRGIIQMYTQKMSQVDRLIRKMILESLGCEKYLDGHFGSTHHNFRWSRYSALGTFYDELVVRGHPDKSFLSILYQNGDDELEIQNENGNGISYDNNRTRLSSWSETRST